MGETGGVVEAFAEQPKAGFGRRSLVVSVLEDPDHGVGVCRTNEEVVEVTVQVIFLTPRNKNYLKVGDSEIRTCCMLWQCSLKDGPNTHYADTEIDLPDVELFIHQNAILALQAVSIAPNHHLLLTGGDDNAFGITLTRSTASGSKWPNNTPPPPQFRTLLIPHAHVAAITALAILDSHRQADHLLILTALSTGNDQRVKIWRISIDIKELLARIDEEDDAFGPAVLDAVDVQLVQQRWTDVADASSLVIIPDADVDADAVEGAREVEMEVLEAESKRRSKRLMIAGIGMEMVRVDLVDGWK